MNLEYQIAKKLGVNKSLIQKTPKVEMGDYCLPCFMFAKEKRAPRPRKMPQPRRKGTCLPPV